MPKCDFNKVARQLKVIVITDHVEIYSFEIIDISTLLNNENFDRRQRFYLHFSVMKDKESPDVFLPEKKRGKPQITTEITPLFEG